MTTCQLHYLRLFLGVVLVVLAGGCSSPPPVVSKPLPSPVVSHAAETLSPDVVAEAVGYTEGEAYRVGPGDSLLVAVYGHSELSIASYAGGANTQQVGLKIDNDGTIQLPLIGSVKVEGKTVDELRVFLEEALSAYVQEPKVTVQIVFNGTIRYYLLGQFSSPGLKFSDRPMRLMEALSLGGTVELERASLRGAYVAREGKRLPINFRRLLREGDMKQNIPLQTGDVIFVPDSNSERAYVFGGVTGDRAGGSVQFVDGRLDILQALAQAGFGFEERAQGILAETRVIRGEGDRGELFVVDVERILEGEAANFELAPGDVIFVPTTAVTDWNLALRQILPTLQTVSALLNPFVSLKLLQER